MSERSIDLKLFSEFDDIDELTKLLNLAYKRWADMGFRYMASWQTADITKERLQNGQCYIYKQNRQIIATVTYYRHKAHGEHEIYLRPDVATYGQLAVHPTFQKRGLASYMIKFVEQLARNGGAKKIIIDTAENNTELVNYYTSKGYIIVERTNWPATNYTSVFLSKDL